MRFLYVFPHPDDESFGPAPAMFRQRREGHDVFLLTLTKGGATKVRHELGYSVEEMGAVRHREMLNVAEVLNLSGMTVLDLPDGGLKEMNPMQIESAIKEHILKIKPHILVTYAVHGISGFHDHLVTHAAVKRVYVEMKEGGDPDLKRLAFFTVTEETAGKAGIHALKWSTDAEIDCAVRVDAEDIRAFQQALDCYVTYRETIEQSNIRKLVTETVVFEIFQENHDPHLADLAENLRYD